MRIEQLDNSMTVLASQDEIWFLSRFHAPGLLFGIDDPWKNLELIKLKEKEESTKKGLQKEGIIRIEDNNVIKVDSFINGMVYSLINQDHMLIFHDNINDHDVFIVFLPDWQMSFENVGENLSLTVFKNETSLLEWINEKYLSKMSANSNGVSFSIPRKEFDLACYLTENGKRDEALKLMHEFKTETWSSFIEDISSPSQEIEINFIRFIHNPEKIRQKQGRLLNANLSNFWVTQDVVGEEGLEYLHFLPVSPKEFESILKDMIKKIKSN